MDEQRREREGKEADKDSDRARERRTDAAGPADRTDRSGDCSSGTAKMMSASPVGNFYIYSSDGKLLQVYDVYGALLKDFIYMGSRLIAEYDHVGARLLYYTPDQINSTRVVTDQSGNVVYSATYAPYGEIRTEQGTVDPLPKFSGKERDAESQLDYFGARYFDRNIYRFISVDPGATSSDAAINQQYLNLYSYCLNNPALGMDPDGRDVIISVFRTSSTPNSTTGIMFLCDKSLYPTESLGPTWELGYNNNAQNISCIESGIYTGHAVLRLDLGYDVIQLDNVKGRMSIQIHPHGRRNYGCIGMKRGWAFQSLMGKLGIMGNFPYFGPNGGINIDVPISNGPIIVYVFWWDFPKIKELIPIVTYTYKVTKVF
ncbi:MAG: hypothetical protein KA243_06680 [Candidatus Aminicenantes bacterium]|nr:hypothetical protein [Candidatus Aminicenantes bacterium]